jgi:tetratricopeptide (TPR) repeat protein
MRRLRDFFIAGFLLLAAAWIYAPALRGGWLWDDNTEMPQMAALAGPGALARIWIHPDTGDYYPVKTTLEWLQWRWWGNDTLGYHLTNVALHVAGALLLWRLLRQLGARCARFAALVWVVHPLAVESVAWSDELKNTLSLPLLLLAMMAYVAWDQRRERGGAASLYLAAVGCFLLAMLSKSSVVMFPVVLLLYAWWRRGAIGWRDLRATAPFFTVSLALGVVALCFQQQHGLAGLTIPLGGPATRLARAGLMAASYLRLALLPVNLMPIYPRWTVHALAPASFLPWIALAAGFALLWPRRATWGRHVLLGLGWFFLNLVPVLGFVTISHFRFTWTMDHLAYLPLAGLVGLGAAGLGALEARWAQPHRAWRWGAMGLAAALCALLATESRRLAAHFQSEESFWSYALERNPDAWLAHNNLGDVLLARGERAAAIAHFQRALQLYPDYAEAEYNLGLAEAGAGQLEAAAGHYAASLRLEPRNGDARNNLGNAYLRLGRTPEAVDQYAEAVRLDPSDVQARCNLGVGLMRLGRRDEAIAQYREAQRLRPDWAPAHTDLGNAWAQLGRTRDAIAEYEIALKLAPEDADLRFNLGSALAQAGRGSEAAVQFAAVLRLRPDDAEARASLQRLQSPSP